MIGLILNIIYLKAMEKTYVMIKPDGVQRGLIGRIIQKFEDKGLQSPKISRFEADLAVAKLVIPKYGT